MAYWLMKSEPDELSIKGLETLGKARWDGVRNYQARNFLRAMAVGDEFFFYHSSCPEPGIAGIGRIIQAAYPDPTALDPESHAREKRLECDRCCTRRDLCPGAETGLSEAADRTGRDAAGAKRQPSFGHAGDRRTVGRRARIALRTLRSRFFTRKKG